MAAPYNEPTFERPQPHSSETERAMLGSVLLDNSLIDQALNLTRPEHYHVTPHRVIFCAMMELREQNSEINSISIGDVLRRQNRLESVGGYTFITQLTYGLPHSSNLAPFARVLHEMYAYRWAINESLLILSDAYDQQDEPAVIYDRVIEKFSARKEAMTPRGTVGGPLLGLTQDVEDHLYRIKAGMDPAIPTGLSVLDSLTAGGCPPGETWGIGALSSKGKSSLLVQLLKFMARQGSAVVLFSLEMKALSIALRMLSAECGIPMNKLRVGLKDSEIEYLLSQAKTAFDVPFWIYTDCRSISDIRARLKQLKRKTDIKVVGIDYYGLLSGYGGGRDRYENRTQELKYIAGALQQQIAIDENVGLIIPAQFNRSGWSIKDPGPANIDGGEAFYQACDLYATLGMESSKPGEKTAKAHLSVWKQRNGPTAIGKERLKLTFHRERMEFYPALEDEGEVDQPTETTEEGNGYL